jgi:hypothetical protein
MAGEVKITVVKDGKGDVGSTQSSGQRSIQEPISDASMPLFGKVARLASLAALSKVSYDLAKKTYNRLNKIETEGRIIEEELRNRGGDGWSSNTIGDRFNVFGKQLDGESVAYKR